MAEGFRSFAELLARTEFDEIAGGDDAAQSAATLRQAQGDKGGTVVPSANAAMPSVDDAAHECECTARAVREVRLFCARVAEAVETAAHDLLTDIASEVLARELELQPADLRAIVDRTLARFSADIPVRIRIAPGECPFELTPAVQVVRDAALLPGDAIVEFHSGTVDARFGARLARVLASLS